MHLPPPRDNRYLFLDMNAYFASCEQHRRPALRGKPLIVTPTLAPSGAVIAASYAAKQHGVFTGMRIQDALQRIPTLAIIPADPKYYTVIHHEIMALLEREICPSPQALSVDEFAIPLDTYESWTPHAHALARLLKQRLREQWSEALTCSIGIGPNIFLAKLGTELHKPNGLSMLQLHTLGRAFRSLSLRGIPGINWGMSWRLHSAGIRTAYQFYQAPHTLLQNLFGTLGDVWWHQLHGYDVSRSVRTIPKTMSHSHVLAPKLRSKDGGQAVLYKLCLKLAERLRHHTLVTRSLFLSVRTLAHGRWQETLTFHPTDDLFSLFPLMRQRYTEALSLEAAPFKISITLHELQTSQQTSLPLFGATTHATSLFQAVDTINQNYGRWTIQPASLLPIQDAAPNRIAFHAPQYDMD